MSAPLRLEQVGNFRDIGGYAARAGKVRSGAIYRSGHLSAATAADLEALSSLGLRTVVDFRHTGDMSADGAPKQVGGTRRVHLPMGDPATGADDIRQLLFEADDAALRAALGDGRAEELMEAGAAALVTDRLAEYAGMVRALLESEAIPALLHCSAGKDRTGWAVSLLLLAVGVSREDAIAEYVLSNELRRAENRFALSRYEGRIDIELVRPFMEVQPRYARASFAAVDRDFGGIDGYLRDGLGLDAADVARLGELLVE